MYTSEWPFQFSPPVWPVTNMMKSVVQALSLLRVEHFINLDDWLIQIPDRNRYEEHFNLT